MLAEWQQLQAEVWELDSRARHLEPATHSAAEELARHRQYHAELAHTLRQLRSASSGSANSTSSSSSSNSHAGASSHWPPHFSGKAKSLEEIFGHSSAQAWETFFRALKRCPRAVPAIAHIAGYQSYEAFAHIALCLVDDALLFGMQGGAGLVCTLDEVLHFEFDALVLEDTGPQVATLLADGSFLAVLTQLLTSHAPSCMAWAEDAIGAHVMEAVAQAVAASSGGDSMAAARQRRNTDPVSHNESVVSDEGIQAFIGEEVAPPGPFPGTGQAQQLRRSRTMSESESKQAIDVALCHAAAVVVSSLCERACSAPMELCRLVAALCRQLSKRCSSEVANAAQNALLGSLLLTRWLVPSLLTPGQLGHSLGFGLANAEPHVSVVLVRLAKLLKAIASDTSQSNADVSPELCGASPEFIRQEAQKLRTGLFNTLRARGECGATEVSHGIVWPRCLVCTSTDLGVIIQAVATQPAVMEAATSQGMPADVMNAIASLPQICGTPEVVLVWLQNGETPALPRIVTDQAGHEDRGSTGGTAAPEECGLLPDGALRVGHDNFLHSETTVTRPSIQGDAGGTASIVNVGSGGTGAPGNSLPAGSGNEQLMSGLEQLWSVLAEPHPLEGPPDASLLSVLHSRHSKRLGWTLTQLLRLEMLEEWLRSHLASRSGCVAGTVGGREQQLLNDFRRVLANRRASVSQIQRLFYQLQVAHRLVDQHIAEVSHALRHCARVASELRCSVYLQSLWNSSASNPRKPRAPEEENCERCGPDGPLEFCMLSPPKPRSGAKMPQSKVKNRWVANLFGTSPSTISSSSSTSTLDVGDLSRLPSSASTASLPTATTGGMPIQASVQIFEVSRCPYHRIAAVSTTMGLEHLTLEQSVKHRTPRNLRQAILAFQQLPLESIVQAEDPLNIAAAIHAFIDMLAARLLTRCKAQDPMPALKSASAGFGSGNSVVSQGLGMVSEERPRPADIIRTDERQISEYVAHYIFGHLHSRLFSHEPTDADLRMAERISRLAWLKPRHLDVPEAAFELAQVSEAIKILRRLCRLRTPGDMLASLANAFRNVSEAACLRAQLRVHRSSSSHGGRDAFGADDLLPLFILVVLRANPPMFNSVLLYIERLTSREQMKSEQGYTLTQLHLAVSFTESVRAADLEGLDPGEWERHMSATEPGR